jgi:NAD(P)-dependent dehydrogenase (short-subunit alcohol dehydrogenase family)
MAVAADVSREEEVEALFGAATAAFGRVDGVVSNAGLTRGFVSSTPGWDG